MNIAIESSWKTVLHNEFEKEYFKELTSYVKEEYAHHTCFPPENEIFNAFSYCPFDDVKVVIIGQDPYHGVDQANGLCFSVKEGIKHPPSLVNIFKELQTDVGKEYPDSGNLEAWAKQGVLLLNATLTVRAHEAGSHQKKGWETFTDVVIKTISDKKENVVFLLWGGYAKRKVKLIDTNKHDILTSGHPSPLSANRGFWFGNNHFSKCNEILLKNNKEPILW
ncbi:uracil-DNA glycosylase [Galbibacter orientalis DSM 19592]|uniref:Uracil-DNA glycosylase n=1 Tax=Galbibacter orientalis DSM 19592 TaxID=926559 RepID=I3CA65_9FLAO|nr:uracil-DNA glycosylase [Galbibacter orientalis]EIJ40508.1 uracil-DNA glycosylase [Galbibacter orientalis DSM 19592]